MQHEDLNYLQEIKVSDLVASHQEILQPVYDEIQDNIQQTEAFIQQLADDFPKAYRNALTQKSIRM